MRDPRKTRPSGPRPYHVPTWVEYVRHNQRRTHADAANGEKLRQLHRGVEAPRVHRMIERQDHRSA